MWPLHGLGRLILLRAQDPNPVIFWTADLIFWTADPRVSAPKYDRLGHDQGPTPWSWQVPARRGPSDRRVGRYAIAAVKPFTLGRESYGAFCFRNCPCRDA